MTGEACEMSKQSMLIGFVIGVVSATAAVGIAVAAIPDSSGKIHACYQNVTSANKPIKLLDIAKASACPSGWKPVVWNQQGVQGPPGPAGSSLVLRSIGTKQTVPGGSGDGTLPYYNA